MAKSETWHPTNRAGFWWNCECMCAILYDVFPLFVQDKFLPSETITADLVRSFQLLSHLLHDFKSNIEV